MINGGVNGGVKLLQLTERQKIMVRMIRSSIAKNGGVNSSQLAQMMNTRKPNWSKILTASMDGNRIGIKFRCAESKALDKANKKI